MTETKINKWFSAIKRSDIRYLRRNMSKEMLLSENEEVYSKSLHYAVRCNKYTVVEFLLDNNIDGAIDINEDYEGTPLDCCIDKNRHRIARLLLERGAKFDDETIRQCAYNAAADVLELLLQYNTDVNSVNCYGNTSLMLLCADRENFHDNLPEPEDPYRWEFDKVDKRDHTKYMKVNRQVIIDICRKELRCAELLLDNGANLTITNSLNETALYKALTDNNIEMVKLLLRCGAELLNGLDEEFDDSEFEYENMNRFIIMKLVKKGIVLNRNMCFNYNKIKKETHDLIKDLDDYDEFVRINENSHYDEKTSNEFRK